MQTWGPLILIGILVAYALLADRVPRDTRRQLFWWIVTAVVIFGAIGFIYTVATTGSIPGGESDYHHPQSG